MSVQQARVVTTRGSARGASREIGGANSVTVRRGGRSCVRGTEPENGVNASYATENECGLPSGSAHCGVAGTCRRSARSREKNRTHADGNGQPLPKAKQTNAKRKRNRKPKRKILSVSRESHTLIKHTRTHAQHERHAPTHSILHRTCTRHHRSRISVGIHPTDMRHAMPAPHTSPSILIASRMHPIIVPSWLHGRLPRTPTDPCTHPAAPHTRDAHGHITVTHTRCSHSSPQSIRACSLAPSGPLTGPLASLASMQTTCGWQWPLALGRHARRTQRPNENERRTPTDFFESNESDRRIPLPLAFGGM